MATIARQSVLCLRPMLPQQLAKRTFASTAARLVSSKPEWLVIVPDNAGMLEKRMEVRPKHLEALKPSIASRTIVWGGQYLGEPLKEGQAPQTKGSAMLVRADTEEEAIKFVKSDIYCDHDIWNTSNIQIHPFKQTDLTAV